MYLAFYNLKYKPFQISTDPKFLWLGEKHEEALATLRYGILDNKGFLLLTGDVGTGKTTLINTLLQSLKKNTLVATIRDPALEPMDFYHYTAHAFGLKNDFTSKASFLIKLEKYLHQAHRSNQKVLLIIDEAQRITQELLEEVRLLSNIEKKEQKLLNIFFVGQVEFNDILLQAENRPIRQRITVNFNIPPLTSKETKEYIYHRLKIAGTTAKLFTDEALDEIFSFSKGYPRLINIICDRSLLTGFVEESATINRNQVKECVKELTIHRSWSTNIHATKNSEETDHPDDVPPDKTSPAPMEISTLPQAGERNSSKNIRNIIILIGILLIGFSYLAYQDNSTLPFKKTASEYAQSILQLTKKLTEQDNHVIENNSIPAEENTTKTKRERTSPSKESEHKPIKDKRLKTINTQAIDQAIKEEVFPMTKASSNPEKASIIIPKSIINQTIQKEKHADFLDNFDKLVIPFPFNSNLPPASSLEKLNMLADALQTRTKYTVTIRGYTDSQGNAAFNNKLSEFRANAVKSYLVGRGLNESSIIAKGMGAQSPVKANNTNSGRTANRRVEIQIEL